jgi:putative DNA primase/helicase
LQNFEAAFLFFAFVPYFARATSFFRILEQNAQNVDTIKRSNNNIIEFLESSGYIRFKADYEVSSKALYEAYKLWCEDNAQHCLSANRLSSELTQNAVRYNVEPTNNIYLAGGRRVRGFIGIEVLAKALY